MTVLSVNLNKVALLRNQRDMPYPSVVGIARMVLGAGAAGVTVHPRPDGRHIRSRDVRDLAAMLKADYGPEIELNVEGYPTAEFLDLVAEVEADQVTLVPDAPDQATSDHGWQVPQSAEFLIRTVARIAESGARTVLFIDADPAMAPAAKAVGADRMELYTGPYGRAFGGPGRKQALEACRRTAEAARQVGLGLNAGHDLNLDNLGTLIDAVPWIAEVSIGHALTADALIYGYEAAVAKYLAALGSGSAPAHGA